MHPCIARRKRQTGCISKLHCARQLPWCQLCWRFVHSPLYRCHLPAQKPCQCRSTGRAVRLQRGEGGRGRLGWSNRFNDVQKIFLAHGEPAAQNDTTKIRMIVQFAHLRPAPPSAGARGQPLLAPPALKEPDDQQFRQNVSADQWMLLGWQHSWHAQPRLCMCNEKVPLKLHCEIALENVPPHICTECPDLLAYCATAGTGSYNCRPHNSSTQG